MLSAKFLVLIASIFKVLQCQSKFMNTLSECQTAWIPMRGRVTRSKLFVYGTTVVSCRLRVNPLSFEFKYSATHLLHINEIRFEKYFLKNKMTPTVALWFGSKLFEMVWWICRLHEVQNLIWPIRPPNKLSSAKLLSASIFKVLQCQSKSVKMLFECQTSWI